MSVKITYTKLLLLVTSLIVISACNPAKKLQEGQYLVHKNIIINHGAQIEKSEIAKYIKLKPNRKILGGFRFHLWLNNQIDENRVKQKRALYNTKIEEKNTRRLAKGKNKVTGKQQIFRERLLNISEPPVIYDSFLIQKSAKQIKLFLNNKGYFVSEVTDSTIFKRKKAKIFYTINASKPYTYNNFFYNVPDKAVLQKILSDTTQSLLKRGKNYDVDILQKERERITKNLNNSGYYQFTQDYVYFEVDTNIGNRQMDVTIGIKNFVKKYNETSDSIIETAHNVFTINNIYIEPGYKTNDTNTTAADTIQVKYVGQKDTSMYHIIYREKLNYKTHVLLAAIFVKNNTKYSLKKVEDTYRRLSELKAFKFINIYFKEVGQGKLDCYIQLSPVYKQSFTIETEGTNTSGNLGVSGSFVLQNRNLLKGAEVLEFRIKGGIAAQGYADNSSKNLTSNARELNTIEFGPELNLYVPRFLLPFRVNPSIRSNPKTIFTSALNYQRRPDYTRTITNFSFGYAWMETAKKKHTISPFVINFVKVSLEPSFYEQLFTNVHDQFILNSFSNHLSTSTRYSFVYNEQDLRKQNNFSYFKLNAESSGSLLRGIYSLGNRLNENTFVKDDQNRYTFLDIAYSQYLRVDIDYRFYLNPSQFNKIVFRFAGGIGKALANFNVLPFERSFFSGGANGLRAWQARTLGPGSYANDGYSYDQFGDGQIETNLEYRFKLFKMLNGALFVDAGNIWLSKPDINRPGGEFELNRFYKEIAIGSGAGVRADFSFFIIRFDLGVKLRDPQFSEKNRWVAKHMFDSGWKTEYNATHTNEYSFFSFNIGIGYPF